MKARRPGDRLRALAAGLCDQTTMHRVIDPIVADLRLEYGEAMRLGQRWRGRLLRVAATFTLLRIMVAKMNWIPDGRGPVMRTAVYSLAATVCVTILFAVPTFLNPLAPQAYYVYMFPQLLAIAIPIGIAIGIVGVLAGAALSSKVKAGVVALAVVGAAAAFVTAGWIGPAANHAARIASGQAPNELDNIDAWSPTELTLGQLNARIHKAADFGLSRDVGYLRFLLQIYYGRWAFPVASLTLTLCLLAVAGFPGAGRKTLGSAAFALMIGYEAASVFAGHLNQQSAMPVLLAAWLPNLLLAAIAVGLMAFSARRPVAYQNRVVS
jgi:hypothetical protein